MRNGKRTSGKNKIADKNSIGIVKPLLLFFFGILVPIITDENNAMKQFTTSEAKKLLKDILAEKKQRAEYFKANGTLKGFVPAK